MRHVYVLIALVLVVWALWGWHILPELNHKAATLPVGIVDMEKVTEEPSKLISQRIESIVQGYYEHFSKIQIQLQQENQKLVDDQKAIGKGDTSALESWTLRRRAFEKKFVDIQKDAEQKKENLSLMHKKVTDDLNAALLEMIQEEARAAGLQIILSKRDILYATDVLDLTPKIQARVDHFLKTFTESIQKVKP